jgi:hypothetical protein
MAITVERNTTLMKQSFFYFLGNCYRTFTVCHSTTSFLNHGRDPVANLKYRELCMNRKNYLAVVAVAMSLLASPAVYAAPAGVHSPLHAMFGNPTKPVKINLRNESGAVIELKINDQVMTLEAGKSLDLKLAIGTRILANNTTPTHPAGSLITEICKQHDGATINIR